MLLSENARIVLQKKYLLNDSSGAVVENSDEMFGMFARVISETEKNYGADYAY